MPCLKIFYPADIRRKMSKELDEVLLNHIRAANFTMVVRAKFHRLIRHKSETFKDFSLRVYQQSAKCHFNNQLETQLRDRHAAGIYHTELEKQLLGETKRMQKTKKKKNIFFSSLGCVCLK